MGHDLDKNQHSVYKLTYHPGACKLNTEDKYITSEIFNRLIDNIFLNQTIYICYLKL
jgi:hypothetical protein